MKTQKKNKQAYLSTGSLKTMLKVEIVQENENNVKIRIIDPPNRFGEELFAKTEDLIYTGN